MKDINGRCDPVRQTAYDIHVYHGHGHLEKVYENALAHRLRKSGLDDRSYDSSPVASSSRAAGGETLPVVSAESVKPG